MTSISSRPLPRALICVAMLVLPGAAWAQAPAEAAATSQPPTVDAVLVALQDVDLALNDIRVRSAVATPEGGAALLELADGTLVDLQLVQVRAGWAVRDLSLVAGNAGSFRSWARPWRRRVEAAENFLAVMERGGVPQRQPEELAPLSWFEDPDESSRLWGMNPVTYRLMQTLQMVPSLQGPMGVGSPTNPVPRRNDQ